MNTKRNLPGLFYKCNSEKRDTSLRRSSVQTPAQGTSQPSQGTSQLSRGMSEHPSQEMSEPSRVISSQQPSQAMSSQQPSRVTSLQQPFQRILQFSWVTAQQTSPVVVPQHSQMVALQPSWLTAPQLSQVVGSQLSRVLALQPFQGTLQLSHVVAPQTSPGTTQLSRVVALQPSPGTSHLSRVVALQPSSGTSQPSWVSASPAPPPAPPIPTTSPPAQPCCHRLSDLLSRGARRLQQRCSFVWERISSPEKDPFYLPWAKLAAKSEGRAEGSRGTTLPLLPIQTPAAEAAGPATTRAQPKKQVAPKNAAPPPGERNPRGAPQAGTGPLPSSRVCASQQPRQKQQQQLQPQLPQQPRRLSPTRTHSRSLRNPGAASRPDPEAAVPATQYTINLTAEATWLLLRRHLENHWGWMNPFGGTGLLPGSQNRTGMDLTSLIKISLPNEQNRYDDEEYKEDLVPQVMDQELVRRCMEWLHGVEEAKREGKLETLPHLHDP